MSRHYASDFETIRAPHWDEDEYVRIRKYLTRGMKRRLELQMMQFISLGDIDPAHPEAAADNLKIDITAAMTGGQDEELLLWVVDWELSDGLGGRLPQGQQGLDELVEADYDFIAEAINTRAKQKQISQEVKEAFLEKHAAGTQATTA